MDGTTMNKTIARRRPPRFELIAGAVCLDFTNTLDDRFSNQPKELLAQYVDLARFAEDSGILTGMQVDRLIERSGSNSEAAGRALAAAIEMREAMFAVFWAVVNRKAAPPVALIKLNQYVQRAAQHAQLVQVSGSPITARFEWRFDDTPSDFEAPLWPIARSAADLLASEQLAYVRPCASKTCLWLFLDVSKNHRRRWCDMTKCGNRAKFQRFYDRKKKGAV
jgi:predicted RNA-binding Zn ribbon-like protein